LLQLERNIKTKEFLNLFTKRGYIKLIKILKFCKSRNISFKELEKNIKAYKAGNGSKLIYSPKLPIKINPIFDMVLTHHFFDGYICRDNKAGYKQVKDKNLRKNFKQKLEYILGKIKTEANEKETIFMPRFLAEIYKKIYNIRSFGSLINRIPDSIKNKSKFYKVAILTAAIGDEGNVDSNEIIVYSANKPLLLDLAEITKNLKYKYKLVTRKNRARSYELHIFSVSKFYKDFSELKVKYPFLTLGEKEKWLEFYVKKNKRGWWRKKVGETKQSIINLLSKKPMRLKDLEFILNIDRSRIRRHLKHLASWGIITNKANGTWKISESNLSKIFEKIYRKTHHQFIELKKKKEFSKKIILDAIKEGYEIVPEIASKIKRLSKKTIQKYLEILQKEGKVKREGRKIIGYAVFNVWKAL
jgi:predicted transcriptional regulator